LVLAKKIEDAINLPPASDLFAAVSPLFAKKIE
jgi:hypothetical protein